MKASLEEPEFYLDTEAFANEKVSGAVVVVAALTPTAGVVATNSPGPTHDPSIPQP
jgi:hypothetical protein